MNRIIPFAFTAMMLAIIFSAGYASAQSLINPICSGNCMSNPCYQYNDCKQIFGTCKTGYCCEGGCTEINPQPLKCQGTCMANDCYKYIDCKPMKGECESGNCCEGTCSQVSDTTDSKMEYVYTHMDDLLKKIDDMGQNVQSIDEKVKIMPKLLLHGTAYENGEHAMAFMQVLNNDNQPITENDTSCWVTIYYPSIDIYKYRQKMSYADEGLFYYTTQVPYMGGVYMVSGFCSIPSAQNLIMNTIDDDFECGSTNCGTGWSDNWTLNGATVGTGSSHTGSYALNLADDVTPERNFYGNESADELNVRFWYKCDSIDNSGEWFKVVIDDADGTTFDTIACVYGMDDNVWREYTGSFYKDADGFNMSGNITFRVETSGNLNTQDFFDLDDIYMELSGSIPQNSTEYQIFVAPSGEMKVSSKSQYQYTFDNATMEANTVYYGYVYTNYTVYSKTIVNVSDETVEITTPYEFVCGTVEWVKDADGNELNYMLENYPAEKSCIVKITMDLDESGIHKVSMKLKNIWKKEHYNIHQAEYVKYQGISYMCEDYKDNNGFPDYEIPLVSAPDSGDDMYDLCNYYLDLWYKYNATFYQLDSIWYELSGLDEFNDIEAKMPMLDKLSEELDTTSDAIVQRALLTNAFAPYMGELRPYLTNATNYIINRTASYYIYEWMTENASTSDEVNSLIDSLANDLANVTNITMNISYDISEVPFETWEIFFQRGTPPLLPSTNYYCDPNDPNTLIKNVTYNFVGNKYGGYYSKAEPIECEYGCINTSLFVGHASCAPPPSQKYVIGIIILAIIGFILFILNERGVITL